MLNYYLSVYFIQQREIIKFFRSQSSETWIFREKRKATRGDQKIFAIKI